MAYAYRDRDSGGVTLGSTSAGCASTSAPAGGSSSTASAQSITSVASTGSVTGTGSITGTGSMTGRTTLSHIPLPFQWQRLTILFMQARPRLVLLVLQLLLRVLLVLVALWRSLEKALVLQVLRLLLWRCCKDVDYFSNKSWEMERSNRYTLRGMD